MTRFIKAKLKRSDYQTNIDKYREYFIKINLPKNHHSKIQDDKAIISCKKYMKKCKNQQSYRVDFYIKPDCI